MAKTYTVDLPVTQTRELRYTRVERMEFEKRFRHFGLPGMKEILFDRVFPVRPDPSNDGKMTPTGGGDLEAQTAFIWMGIRHKNPKFITEEKVGEWLDLAITEGRPMLLFLAEAVNAVCDSGVLGYVIDRAVSEEEPGKAPEVTTGA